MDWINSEDAAALGLSTEISAEAWTDYIANYRPLDSDLLARPVTDALAKLTSTVWNFNTLH